MQGRILCGDVRSVLESLPASTCHLMVTSPPYFGALRSYACRRKFPSEVSARQWLESTLADWNGRFGSDVSLYKGQPVVPDPGGASWSTGIVCLSVWGGQKDCKHVWAAKDDPARMRKTATHELILCESCGARLGQIGWEPLHDCGAWVCGAPPCGRCYVCSLREVMGSPKFPSGVWRVLRDDGLCFLNVGDVWAGSGLPGLKGGDRCFIPDRVALALQADGWYVRDFLCWVKGFSPFDPGIDYVGAVMPASVHGWRWVKHRIKVGRSPRARPGIYRAEASGSPQSAFGSSGTGGSAPAVECPGSEECSPNDGFVLKKGSWRPTNAYEPILLLAKRKQYFSDPEAIREEWRDGRCGAAVPHHALWTENAETGNGAANPGEENPPMTFGRNPRNVWLVGTGQKEASHYAVWPPKLVELMLNVGCPERCCPKCGAPWARVVEVWTTPHNCATNTKFPDGTAGKRVQMAVRESRALGMELAARGRTLGFRPTCSCGESSSVPGTVLDIFSGSGTTALVAMRMHRSFIAVDCMPNYVEEAVKLVVGDAPLFNRGGVGTDL